MNSKFTLTKIWISKSMEAPFKNLSASGLTSIVKFEGPGGMYVFALEVIRNCPVAGSHEITALGSSDPSQLSESSISSMVLASPPISNILPLILIGLVSSPLTTSSEIVSNSISMSAFEKTVVLIVEER